MIEGRVRKRRINLRNALLGGLDLRGESFNGGLDAGRRTPDAGR
jgi:hypothetical protein